MKSKEELNALKAEVETLSENLRALTEEELAQVVGGGSGGYGPGTSHPNCYFCNTPLVATGQSEFIDGLGWMKISRCPNTNCPQAKHDEKDGSITYKTYYYC